MIANRVRKNIGFFIAGAILALVAFNVWFEINSNQKGSDPCQSISTQ